jgi:ribosomal protein L37E
MKKATCPVCGYPELSEHFEQHEICASCGFQFSYTDLHDGYSYAQWRQKWIAEGMIWDEGNSSPPKGWNPRTQLRMIGIVIE